ncbi:MAG: hypothetical protein OXF50_23675 [Caldilineaceae bacterium]|nr:hypothetical protein [Caldilineaceae bacterium]
MKLTTLFIILTLLLSACAPIPPYPPLEPPPSEIKAGLTDLANAMAKTDDPNNNVSEYMEALLHIEKCLADELGGGSFLTDEETTAFILYSIGALSTARILEKYLTAQETDEEVYTSYFRMGYQSLRLLKEDCEESD